jgi:hypothetical protein
LNLLAKPDAVDPAEAIDCIDVTFSDRGAIQERPGYKALSKALTNRVESIEPYYTTSGTAQLLAGCGTRLEGLSSAGAVVASATGLTKGIWDFARFGKPNAEVCYSGNGSDTLRKWNGSEWTAPTASVDGEGAKAMPKAGSICVWPEAGNRLVATRFSTTTGGPGGATSSPSHVWFSDFGDPESWHTKEPEENQVQLFPGNGEAIQAAIAWKEFVFVFKETCFFVFYSSGSAGEGTPTFNFRPIEAGVGMVSPRAVCAHHTGVYFMSRQGVYRTTGQEPELVSSLVEPIWTGDVSPFFTGGTISQSAITECAMGVDHEDRIRLTYSTGTETRGLIYDPQFSWWSLDSIPASCYAVFRPENKSELVFGYSIGEKFVGRHHAGLTSDEGAAIEGFWRSGWFDLGNPDVKTIRSSKIWGMGVVEMSIDKDFTIQAEEGEELDMRGGTGSTFGGEGMFGGEGIFGDVAQDLLPAFNNRDQRGTVFSVRYSSSTLEVPWSVHRADFHLREVSKPSTLTA